MNNFIIISIRSLLFLFYDATWMYYRYVIRISCRFYINYFYNIIHKYIFIIPISIFIYYLYDANKNIIAIIKIITNTTIINLSLNINSIFMHMIVYKISISLSISFYNIRRHNPKHQNYNQIVKHLYS